MLVVSAADARRSWTDTAASSRTEGPSRNPREWREERKAGEEEKQRELA